MTLFRARWLCWIVALLAALPLAGPGRDRFYCRGMGRVLDACCCGASAAARSAGSRVEAERARAAVDAPSCCQRLRGEWSNTAGALRDAGPAPLQLVATLPAPSLVAARGVAARELVLAPVEARASPPRGPPLFLRNCSFLI